MSFLKILGRRCLRETVATRGQRIRRRQLRAFETIESRLMLTATLSDRAISPEWFADVAQVVAAAGAPSAADVSSFVGPIMPSRWIVQLAPDATARAATPAGAATMLATAGLPIRTLNGLGAKGVVSVTLLAEADAAAGMLRAIDGIEHFEPVRAVANLGAEPGIVFPNETFFAEQWNLHNDGSGGGLPDADIDAPEAWGIRTDASEVVVAVVDSGIDYSHPDLAANMWRNPGEIANNGIDDDQNGRIDDFYGYDFVNNDGDPNDDVGHGTAVAGVIGAVGNNNLAISGIAWNAKLMSLKFIASSTTAGGAGTQDNAVQAIDYATMMRTQFGVNIRVINASWGLGGSEDPFLKAAIKRAGDAGILVVAGAGNGDALFRGLDLDEFPFFPASTNLDNVIAVAASDHEDQLARFSNYGAASVDLMAPGVGVYSTRRGGGLDINNGTSVAAPHVSGVAALLFAELMSSTPDVSPLEVKEAILAGADGLVAWQAKIAGGRRLNAFGALAVDKVRPRATLVSAPSITTEELGTETQTIVVRYTDDRMVDASMLGDENILVRRRIDGAEFPATLASYEAAPDGAFGYDVTYSMPAPGDTWDPLDNAPHYDITLQSGQILDGEANYVPTAVLGDFAVEITTDGYLTVNTANDTPDINPGDGRAQDAAGKTSLRAAVMEANALPLDNIYILLPAGEYRLAIAGRNEDAAATGDLDVDRAQSGPFAPTLTILGGVATQEFPGGAVIDANGLDRILDVSSGNELHLENVVLRGGDALPGDGGGVRNAGGLTLVNATVSGNRAVRGGGIYSTGIVQVTESEIGNNSATGNGGGIYNADQAADDQPTLVIERSTIATNTALNGAGIYHADARDSAEVVVGPLVITNSTISGNRAQHRGGGIFSTNTARGSIDNSTIVANEADGGDEADDLVGWWRGEDNTVDESAATGSVSAIGGVTYRPGMFGGKAFHLDGTAGTRLQVPNAAAMQHQELTLQAWVRAEDLAPESEDLFGGVIFAKDNGVSTIGTGSTILVTGPGTNGNFYFQLQWRHGTNVYVTPPLLTYYAFAPTMFHHVAITWDGRTARFYVDGKQAFFRYDTDGDGTPNEFVEIPIPANFDADPSNDWYLDYDASMPLTIGEHAPEFIGDSRPFFGLIDETAVFSRALTADEMLATYELGLPNFLDVGGGIYRSREGQDLIGHWRDGANANDSAGNHHGTALGSVSPATGRDGAANSAWDFGATPNTRVEVPFSPDFVVEKFSVDAWVRADTPEPGDFDGRGNVIVAFNNTPNLTFKMSGPGADGKFTFSATFSNGVTTRVSPPFRTSTAFAFAAWHHVAMTWDGKQLLGYVNGQERIRVDIPENNDSNPNNDLGLDLSPLWPLTFGGLRTSSGGLMDGRIDEAALFGRVLNAQEIQAIYQGDDRAKTQASLGALALTNSIVAANLGIGSPDVAGQVTSLGYNLIGNVGTAAGFGAAGDLVGRNGSGIIDPRLGALAFNGGRTKTHAVLSGSPAIDAGSNAATKPFDQRGVSRPQDANGDGTATADIGAVERFYGTISGRVFADQDQNGQAGSGEAGVFGWNMILERQTNGVWTLAAQQTTNASGEYTFLDVAPGVYRVRVHSQSSWLPTTPSTGEQSFDLLPGGIEDATDFGFFASLGEIRGRVFHDLDRNGIDDLERDDGTALPGDNLEPGLADRIVFLDLNGNELLDNPSATCEPSDNPAHEPCVRTGVDGEYVFANLEPGQSYVVRQVPVTGWPLTLPAPLPPPHAAAGDRVYVVEMTAGGRHADLSFGSYPASVASYTVGGRVFDDRNSNGIWDDGDLPLGNLKVYIDNNANGVYDTGEPFATTRADNGTYNLPAPPGFREIRVEEASSSLRQASPLKNVLHLGGATTTTSGNLRDIVAADFDGDGDVDIATLDAATNAVVIMRNAGNGTFTSGANDRITVGGVPVALIAGDFLDADGDLDLITSNSQTAASAISVLRNNGGTFSQYAGNAYGVPAGSGPYASVGALTSIDFDGDTDLDVALTDSSLHKVYLFRNNGNATFTLVQTLDGFGQTPIAIVSGHFNDDNGDGRRDRFDRADLAVASYGQGAGASSSDDGLNSRVFVLLNQGNQVFTRQDITGHGKGTNDMTVADVDRDGDEDLVVVNFRSDTGQILWNNGAGVFSLQDNFVFAAGAGPSAVVAEDMDLDGDQDLLIANSATQKVSVLRNPGDGNFELPEVFGVLSYASAVYITLATGDFNDDGVLDVAMAHGAQGVLTIVENSLASGGRRVVLNGSNVSNVDFAFRSATAATIAGRRIFYGNSAFDNGQGSANPAAIAADKFALLPGQPATFANYTSYSRGINGIFVDINDLATTSLTADDFEFRAGTTGDPADWTIVAGAISVAPGIGTGGADRVTIRFADDTARNKWLRVVVKANANTGLLVDDVHYWGNAPGETGDSPSDTRVDFVDVAGIRQNTTSTATVANVYDINRDGIVNTADVDLIINGFRNTILGDRNRDDLVGLSDIAVVQSRFGVVGRTNNFSGDINDDGLVNRLDIATLAGDFGRRATTEMVNSRLPLLAAPTSAASTAAPGAILAAVDRNQNERATDQALRQPMRAIARAERTEGDRGIPRSPSNTAISEAELSGSSRSASLFARRLRDIGHRAILRSGAAAVDAAIASK
jgi:subtilisin family serine protease